MAHITEQRAIEQAELEKRMALIFASFNLQIDLKKAENFITAQLQEYGVEATDNEIRSSMISLLQNGIFEIKELGTSTGRGFLLVNVNFRRQLSP